MDENKKYKTETHENATITTTFSNGLYGEPQLWEYTGFDDPETSLVYATAYNRIDCHECKDCFFRCFFIDHVTQGVLQLRGGKY